MRVVLDARVQSGVPGGVEQVIQGVVAGLGDLPADGDTFEVLVNETEWIAGFVRAPVRLEVTSPVSVGVVGRVIRGLGRALPRGEWRGIAFDPILEQSGADVLHLFRQNSPATSLPNIYHAYDLQHMHLPDFFSDVERTERRRLYEAHCRGASFVIVMTRWAKDDLCERLSVSPSKVAVVPLPPFVRLLPEADPADLERLQERIPAEFALFPAQTWPHKNHLMLFEALARLRDEGTVVPLVCCGTHNGFFPELQAAVARLGLEDQVHFLGWVDNRTLLTLYRAARCLVFPSRFEGWGMPVTEAFETGLPVACSDAAWLPEQMRGATALLDPMDPASIASAIEEVWADEAARARLIAEGSRRVASLQWPDVAATFKALYRSAASEGLSVADHQWLAAAGVDG